VSGGIDLRREKRRTAMRFAAFVVWPLLLVSVNGPIMSDAVLLASMRLVDHGSWTLTDEHDPQVAFLTLAHDISVHEGRIYAGVAPGASLVAAPVYALLRPLLAQFDEGAIPRGRLRTYYLNFSRALGRPFSEHFARMFALQIALVWLVVAPLWASFLVRFHRWLRERGHRDGEATLVAVALGLGTMALFYGAAYSRQALAYLLLWHALLTLSRREQPALGGCLLAGSMAALALAVDYAAVMLLILGLAFLVPPLDRRRRWAVLLPLGAGCVLLALFHQTHFGSPFSTPYHHRYWHTPEALAASGVQLDYEQVFGQLGNPPSPSVMLQLCFGTYKGLFVYSPVLLLGLARHLAGSGRRGLQRRAHVLSLAVFLCYLTYNGTLGTHVPEYGRQFWGGLGVLWGPRYLFAVLPFLAWGIATRERRGAWARPVLFAALAFSVLLNVAATMFADVIAETNAFGPELRHPPLYVLGLLAGSGPRVPLLDVYGVGPVVQTLVVLALAAVSAALLRGRIAAGRVS
jgi:hypothetical protein